MELIELSSIIHDNAKRHGWWDEKRSIDEIIALFHTELSEAFEEYRAGKPMVYHVCTGGLDNCLCDGHPTMDQGDVCLRDEYRQCNYRRAKPEGIAVELVDFVIRVLDYVGYYKIITTEVSTLEELVENTPEKAREAKLPEIVAGLHLQTSRAYAALRDGGILGENATEHFGRLYGAIGMACAWIEAQGYDYRAIIMEKHEYNKTRSYKHGGKVC